MKAINPFAILEVDEAATREEITPLTAAWRACTIRTVTPTGPPGTWRHGNGYKPGIFLQDLIDSVRGWWKISPKTIQRRGIRHAVAVYDGVTRLLMEIGSWTRRDDGRRALTATPILEGPIFDTWVGPVGKRVTFTAGAVNPIAYWPFRHRPSNGVEPHPG